MDAKQPGKGVYRVEYEAQEDEAGNAATELATFKNLPGAPGGPAQPVLREMSPLASTAGGAPPHAGPQAMHPSQRPNAQLHRTLAMSEAPPHLIPPIQPRRADPVPYLQMPSQVPSQGQPPIPSSRQGGPMMGPPASMQAPSSMQGQPPQLQHGHAPPPQPQRWEPAPGSQERISVAGVPSASRGWLLFALVLLGFVVAAGALYFFLFRAQ